MGESPFYKIININNKRRGDERGEGDKKGDMVEGGRRGGRRRVIEGGRGKYQNKQSVVCIVSVISSIVDVPSPKHVMYLWCPYISTIDPAWLDRCY